MTFKQSPLLFTMLSAILFALGYLIAASSAQQQQTPIAGNFDAGISAMTRSATVLVGTGSTGVASTSSGRRFLQIQNTSSTVTAFCAYSGTTAAVGTQGFFIAASSTVSFPAGDGPMYTGSINCIASSTIALLVNEG